MKKLRTTEEILDVVLREMTAYGWGWRSDWSDFDGRYLRDQLDELQVWASDSMTIEQEDFTEGTEFMNRHENENE